MTWPGRRDWTIAANTALLTPCLLDPEIVRAIHIHLQVMVMLMGNMIINY